MVAGILTVPGFRCSALTQNPVSGSGGVGSGLSPFEVASVSKRRNPKKEKALRNRAYARKFSRKTSNNRRSRIPREQASESNL